MEEKSDIILLKHADERAFERIYQRHWLKVYRFAGLFLNDDAEREDVLQCVFMRLWNIRTKLDENRPLDPLLFVITRNVVFKTKRRKISTESIEAAMLAGNLDGAYSSVDAEDLKKHIDLLISRLPDRQQEAFRLSREDGLTYKEIAKQMGISEKGAERHISLAIKTIRKNIS